LAVVHDNGDSRFRPSYRIRNWIEKVCMAVAKAKREREKASYMYDLSMGRKERHKLAYPDVSHTGCFTHGTLRLTKPQASLSAARC
jgi:hypothetical protein